MTNLYDLPKDMLIKLIQTIENKTKKECQKNNEKMLHLIIEKQNDLLHLFNCKICKEMILYFEGEEYHTQDVCYTPDGLKYEKILTCELCREMFCNNHSYYLLKKVDQYNCEKCDKIHNFSFSFSICDECVKSPICSFCPIDN